MSLREYARKRDFRKTAEPGPKVPRAKSSHRFVIQKHAASRLHYDFRLEMDGTLKSWAVPKGVPFAKGEKRLAVHVEDHPVSYIYFEGTIPKGQYGGGTVMVWDRGTYEPLSKTPAKDLAGGKLHFTLEGKKLKGEWYLVQLRGSDQWLLIRGGKSMRPVSKRADDFSVLSGKTMAKISKGTSVWHSKRKATADNPSSFRSRIARLAKVKTAPRSKRQRALPAFIEPMKTRLVSSIPSSSDWIYEVKFDGYRALAFVSGGECRLLSRNQKDFSRFKEVKEAVEELDVDDAIIDGEIVALDEKGRSSFQLLQALETGEKRPPLFYYAFDLLHLNGEDLRNLPLTERKEKLEALISSGSDVIRSSVSLEGPQATILQKIRKLGLEGVIAKTKTSKYESGRRTGSWVKLKFHQEQEFVIGGYSDPEGSRKHFGAILVGYYERGEFKFAGKVGTGFNEATIRDLSAKFKKIAATKCPFANLPETKRSRFGRSLTPAEMRRCHWLKPRLVCQVKFSEWTRDGKLRQPVFLGLRADKDAKGVIREKVK